MVPEQSLAYWWAGWVYRLRAYVFIAFGVCHLIVGAGLEAIAGFLESRVGAQGIVGIVHAVGRCSWILGTLVGRATSRGGGSGLRWS